MNFDSSSNHVVAYLVCLLEQGVHRRALTKDNEENEDLSEHSRADSEFPSLSYLRFLLFNR